MKKIAVLFAIALVLGISVTAYAKATKLTLMRKAQATGSESGFVIVNDADGQQTIIQFQVRGMVPGTYYAYYGYAGNYTTLGVLKLNKKGFGHLHANVQGSISPPYWLGISIADPTTSQADVVLGGVGIGT